MRLLLALLFVWPGGAQEAASPGQSVYTANCVFCHGPGARGGSQGGPDLAKSPIVRGDSEGAELAAFLNVGRPEKGMPAFHLPLPQLKNLAAYLHSVVAASEGRPQFGEEILVGNAAAGKRFFESDGRCTQCHAVDKDLKGIGSRYSPLVLQGRLVLPLGKGGYPGFESPDAPRSQVTVTEPGGRSQAGLLLFLSDYYVSFLDSAGQRHTVPREGDTPKVTVKDPLAAHLALQSRLTDQQMHNLTAYLASLK